MPYEDFDPYVDLSEEDELDESEDEDKAPEYKPRSRAAASTSGRVNEKRKQDVYSVPESRLCPPWRMCAYSAQSLYSTSLLSLSNCF
jgi:hypothetical protein